MRRNGETTHKVMKRRVNRWGVSSTTEIIMMRVLRGWGIRGKARVGLRRIRVRRMRLVLVIIRIMRRWTRRGHRTIVMVKWWWGTVCIIQRSRMRTILVLKWRWISLGRVWI